MLQDAFGLLWDAVGCLLPPSPGTQPDLMT